MIIVFVLDTVNHVEIAREEPSLGTNLTLEVKNT
jgi:hypothetical protein